MLKEAAIAMSVVNALRLIPANSLWITLLTVGYRTVSSYGKVAWTSSYYSHA